jgi:general stress protein 26
MAAERDIEDKFWSELKSSPFIMLGVEGSRDAATQPMTANFQDQDREAGVLWVFTAKDHDLTRAIGEGSQAIATFAAKGHDLFASLHGTLTLEEDRATVDRLWNPIIAQWYEGKDDPKLELIRFDLKDAKIWKSDLGGFLRPALNKLFGRAPEAGMDDKVAELNL